VRRRFKDYEWNNLVLLRIRWWREKKGKEKSVCLVEWTEETVVVGFSFYLLSRRRGNNALND